MDNKTTLTFWSGLRSIGGNIAEIRYGTDRIIFDFGYVFYNSVYGSLDEVNRPKQRVVDLLRLGAIPQIEGIYRQTDLVQATNGVHLEPFEDSQWNTAVFISHLHLDHMAAIDTVADGIPIYLSEPSLELYRILRTIGEEQRRERPLKSCSYGETIQIGAIRVTAYRADHDVYGASSFLIETPDLTVVYSGDLRMHGQHPEWNEEWFTIAREKGVDLLLIEATSFKNTAQTEEPLLTERDLPFRIAQEVANHSGLLFMNFYHRNVERLRTFTQLARACNRVPVLETETAYIASKLMPDIPFLILYNNTEKRQEWERQLAEKYLTVTVERLNENPQGYLVQNSFSNRYNLLDMDYANGLYIHANGIPFGEFAAHFEILIEFLNHLSVPYLPFHVSGHATIAHTRKILEAIEPKVIVPWHTMYPQLVQHLNRDLNVFLPEQKIAYVVEERQLIKVDN